MNLNEFVGNWENFENYFDDISPNMQKAWRDSEEAIKKQKKNLIASYLYRNGAKAFWQSACYTINKENKIRLNGLNISTDDESLIVQWYDLNNNLIGKYKYFLDSIIDKGLEGKENYLFKSNENSNFKWLLLMEPMPNKLEKEKSDLIAHFHLQFSSKKENLVNKNMKLVNKHWYATMCEGNVSMLDRCNIVLALHKLKTWSKLED